ncbi:MAG TPA: MBOAT family O-acyltransferase [Candidatus Melainabacteria bacterium]|nr:MBOAT family O-acyltransferase [Candidatus Melainabacteria bacterium]
MNFVSCDFIAFVAATWIAYALAPARYRTMLLLAASYAFYAYWSLPFISVILFTTTIDYAASKYIAKSTSKAHRKFALSSAITLNLLILAVFKYSTFFLTSIKPVAERIGLNQALPDSLNVILPLGISFYTFEAISYLVDVYRGAPPAPNWLKYNFFIMYFPHLLSGPIVRFKELYKQYDTPLQLASKERFAKAAELIILGYVFKVIFADGAAAVCDPMFREPHATSVLNTYVGALAFGSRVYFDLMGYTHIARGVSLLFNIELPLNFNHPIAATNIRDFWARWHISLTRWIRDYLFMPLGRLTSTSEQLAIVLVIVMTLAGLWHGAGWTFMLWGFFHGCLLAFYHAYRRAYLSVGKKYPALKNYLDHSRTYNLVSLVLTQATVMLSLVIFGSPNLKTAVVLIKHLARVDQLVVQLASSISQNQWMAIGTAMVIGIVSYSGPLAARLYNSLFGPLPIFVKTQTATCAVLLCWVLSSGDFRPFVYFQF